MNLSFFEKANQEIKALNDLIEDLKIKKTLAEHLSKAVFDHGIIQKEHDYWPLVKVNVSQADPAQVQKYFEKTFGAYFEILPVQETGTYAQNVKFKGMSFDIFIIKRGQILTVGFEH